MAINKKAIKISKKHLLGIQDLSISDINLILDEAKSFITLNKSKNKKIDILRGKTQINLFFEPSTRTQSSFELAGKRLGADVMSMNITNSAINTSVGVISLAGHWNGDGVNQTGIPTLNSSSRIGNEDNDDASDFTTLSSSANLTNVNLDLPFPSGATWYDLNTNQIIGSGDTIYYSPTQSTHLIGEVIDSLGNIWTDTMYLEVLNPNITSSGISLCNGPLTLNAPTSFIVCSIPTGSTSSL